MLHSIKQKEENKPIPRQALQIVSSALEVCLLLPSDLVQKVQTVNPSSTGLTQNLQLNRCKTKSKQQYSIAILVKSKCQLNVSLPSQPPCGACTKNKCSAEMRVIIHTSTSCQPAVCSKSLTQIARDTGVKTITVLASVEDHNFHEHHHFPTSGISTEISHP